MYALLISIVQLVYAYLDTPTSSYTSTIQLIAREIDATIEIAAVDLDMHRSVGWSEDILLLSLTEDNGTITPIVQQLEAAGHKRLDRKFLVFIDANTGCGMATQALNQKSADGYGVATLWRRCWSGNRALHELLHTLGAVQPGTVCHDTSNYWHSANEADVMHHSAGADIDPDYACYFGIDLPSINVANSPYLRHEAPPVFYNVWLPILRNEICPLYFLH